MNKNDEELKEIRNETKRIEESATYSSETQFEYAKRWRSVDRWLSGSSAVVAAIAGVCGLAQLLTIRWAGFIAILAAALSAMAASIDASQTKANAAASATAYRSLQQDARILSNIDLHNLSNDKALKRVHELADRLQHLNQQSEIPSRGSWLKAKKEVEDGSQNYKVDKR